MSDKATHGRQPAASAAARRGRLLPAGTYLVELAVDKQVLRQELRVETDPVYPNYQPWAMEQTEAELEEGEYEDVETRDGGREWNKLVPFEQEPPEKEEGDQEAEATAERPPEPLVHAVACEYNPAK